MTVETPKKTLPCASFSRLSVYENCPNQYKLKYLDKLPEPDRPVMLDRSGKPKPSAAERGSWIHDNMDQYINDDNQEAIILPELLNIKREVDEIRKIKQATPSEVFTEQKWFFDLDWDQISFSEEQKPEDYDYAIVVIIDAMVKEGNKARIIDLKSGKSYNNATKHAKQLNLYAAAAAHKFPDVEIFSLELLYCDEGQHHVREVSRKQALIYRNYWDHKMMQMHKDKYFDARPSPGSCRFCTRRPTDKPNKWVNGDGACAEFVEHPRDTAWREEHEAKQRKKAT